jgi:hypothetical protein
MRLIRELEKAALGVEAVLPTTYQPARGSKKLQ